MNYLAHAYLSFMHEEIMVGNLISDFVKGKKKFGYKENIRKGIALHRSIDSFTDDHPVTKAAKIYFKPAVGLYSGAFVDVAYDHFLAIGNQYWTDLPLASFALHVYRILEINYVDLPDKLQRMLPYMMDQNWLYNYRFNWGIERSFEGVARRAKYLNNAVDAYKAFISNYDSLQQLSLEFLPDVKKFALDQFHQLINT